MYTIQQSVNFASTFIQYSPLVVGTGGEPAFSIANAVKSTIMNAPLTWPWNRNEYSGLTLVAGTQDYTVAITDFGFLEKITLIDPSDGSTFEILDVYNSKSLGGAADSSVAKRRRPTSCSVVSVIYGTSVKLRFIGVPDKAYTTLITYQKLVNSFGPYAITSAAAASPASLVLSQVTVTGATTVYTGTITGGGTNNYVGMTFVITGFSNASNNTTILVTANTTTTLTCTTATVPQVNETAVGAAAGGQTAYTGIFTPGAFPAGSVATVSGFVTHVGNNGSFVIVSATPTQLVVINSAGLAETIAATVGVTSWTPIPDSFQDVFNSLFLAEAMANVDDVRSQVYRQRGIASLLAKAEGLNEMQINAFLEQYGMRASQQQFRTLRVQQAVQGSGI
jgi:hypothetical protein